MMILYKNGNTILTYLSCESFDCETNLRIKDSIKDLNLLVFLIEHFLNYMASFIFT